MAKILNMNWTETNHFLRGIDSKLDVLPDPIRIASFDLDDTLIHKPRGKKAEDKWKLLDSSISSKIAELVKEKYIIVIVTNQNGMGTNKNFNKIKWRHAISDLAKIITNRIVDQY